VDWGTPLHQQHGAAGSAAHPGQGDTFHRARVAGGRILTPTAHGPWCWPTRAAPNARAADEPALVARYSNNRAQPTGSALPASVNARATHRCSRGLGRHRRIGIALPRCACWRAQTRWPWQGRQACLARKRPGAPAAPATRGRRSSVPTGPTRNVQRTGGNVVGRRGAVAQWDTWRSRQPQSGHAGCPRRTWQCSRQGTWPGRPTPLPRPAACNATTCTCAWLGGMELARPRLELLSHPDDGGRIVTALRYQGSALCKYKAAWRCGVARSPCWLIGQPPASLPPR